MKERDKLGRFQEQERCIRGHLLSETAAFHPSRPDERACSKCRVLNTKDWRKRYPEKAREADRKWHQDNPEKVKEGYKKYYLKNREKRLADSKIRYQKNKELKKWQLIQRTYCLSRNRKMKEINHAALDYLFTSATI